MKDFQERVRQEADKYAGKNSAIIVEGIETFEAGAQAALNILGASASEGDLPRDDVCCCGDSMVGHANSMESGHMPVSGLEYYIHRLKAEHEALRAADLLELEKAREHAEVWKKQYTYEWGFRKQIEKELCQEREARKGDIAELEKTVALHRENYLSVAKQRDMLMEKNARLTAALDKIAAPLPDNEVPDLQDEEASEKWMAASRKRRDLAKEALAEAGKSND